MIWGLALAAAYFGWASVVGGAWRERVFYGLLSMLVIAGAVALRLRGAA